MVKIKPPRRKRRGIKPIVDQTGLFPNKVAPQAAGNATHRDSNNRPISYGEWATYLCTLLKIPPDFNFKDFPLQPPWLLAPQNENDELVNEQLDQLYQVVKRRLTQNKFTNAEIVNTIHSLKGQNLLPLLYALREIARTKGQSNRYWPEVIEGLFDNTAIVRTTFNQYIVPALTDAWQRLYFESEEILYKPVQSSRVHIAWPFAHAGLLASDRNVLIRFGLYLAEDWEKEIEHFPYLLNISSPISQFLEILFKWSTHEQGVAGFLGRLTEDNDEVRLIRVELAKTWLQHNWEAVEKRFQLDLNNIDPNRSSKQIPIKLYFNTQSNRLEVRIGRLVDKQKIRVSVGGEDIDFYARAFTTDNQPVIENAVIPLKTPFWLPYLEIHTDQDYYLRTFPPSPFKDESSQNAILLFRGSDGLHVNRWIPNSNYYAVINTKYDRNSLLKGLFEPNIIDLGAINGSNWDGYSLIYLTSTSLLPNQGLERVTLERHNKLKELASHLGLGGIEELKKFQLRPIGGRQLQPEKNHDSFDVRMPPSFEITGDTPANITLKLEYQDLTYQSFVQYGVPITIQISPGEAAIISIEDNNLFRQGLYRVSGLGFNNYFFYLIEYSDINLPVLRLHCTYQVDDVELQNLQNITYFSRRDLEKGQFYIHAWPEAIILVKAEWENYQYQSTVQLNQEGFGQFTIKEFGLYPAVTNIKFCFKAGPLESDPFFFQVHPLVTSWEAEWSESFNELIGTAHISNLNGQSKALLLILGVTPWSDQIWETEVPIELSDSQQEGRINFNIICNSKLARWIAIFPAKSELINSEVRLLPWLSLKTLKNAPTVPTYSLSDLSQVDDSVNEGNWQIWEQCWSGLSRPPDFVTLLNFSSLNRFVDRYIELFQFKRLKRNWLKVTEALISRLEVLKQYNYKIEFYIRQQGSDESKRGLCTTDGDNEKLLELVRGIVKADQNSTTGNISFYAEAPNTRSRVKPRALMQGRVIVTKTLTGLKYCIEGIDEVELAVGWNPHAALDAIFNRVNNEEASFDPLLQDLQSALGECFEKASEKTPVLAPLPWLENALRSAKLLVKWTNQIDLPIDGSTVAELAAGVSEYGDAVVQLLKFLEKGLNDTYSNR